MRSASRNLPFAILTTAFVLVLTACGISNPAFLAGGDSATVSITLTGPGSVMLGAQSQYAATVTGSSDATVTWSVNGVAGGNSAVGSISDKGLYSAPGSAPQSSTVTITATSAASPAVSKSLPVALASPPASDQGQDITLSIAGPTSLTLGTSSAYVASITGTSNTAVTWSVNGVAGGDAADGLISDTGVYTAPVTAPEDSEVTIEAVSAADPSVSGGITVTLTAAPLAPGWNQDGSGITLLLSGATTLTLASSAQYTATVTGSTDTSVTWTVNGVPGGNSTVGTISNSGHYTAPAKQTSTKTVTIMATSNADSSVSQSLVVALVAPQPPAGGGSGSTVTLTVSGAATVTLGTSAQYTATVTGSNAGVIWSVNGVVGGNSSFGTISSKGRYTAPDEQPDSPEVSITATSVADPSVSRGLHVALAAPTDPPGGGGSNVTLALNGPTTVTLAASSQYSAVVTGSTNTGVMWSVNGVAGGNSTVGTISNKGRYVAPAKHSVPSKITIMGTSLADPSVTSSLAVTLVAPQPAITLSLSGPTSATLGTSSQYSAIVSGSNNTGVIWSVNGNIGGNSKVGTISAKGRYTAPTKQPAASKVTITATSSADPSVARSLVVALVAPPTGPGGNGGGSTVTLALSGATVVTLGDTAQYTATVTGNSDTAVAWSVNGVTGGDTTAGKISSKGLYTAPKDQPQSSKITITATSMADPSVSQNLVVTLSPESQPAVTVTLSGPTSVALGTTAQYSGIVTGSTNTGVTWSVDGLIGGDDSVGVISSSGLYTAPEAALPTPQVTITATSLADSSVSQTMTITLGESAPPDVTLTLSGATKVTLGTSSQYTAVVTGSSNTGVSWSVNGVVGGNTTDGFISTGGLYTAPTTAPQPSTVTVMATSSADPTVAKSIVTTLVPPAGNSRIPNNAIKSADLNASKNWQWRHDPGTPGSSNGTTSYPVGGLSADDAARQFYMTFTSGGGEIYHVSFAKDTVSTHFVYDTYVYVVNPPELKNLEMDMNAVMTNGQTVILATQCSGYSKTWEYTLRSGTKYHWNPSNIPCDPTQWTAKTWHHIQIATHRDNSGNAYYDWVSFDGKYSDFKNAGGTNGKDLGWAVGSLLINFQIDGPSKSNGSNTLYTDKLFVWRW